MSARACPPLERLEALAALPAGDPRRAHLDGCPRCLGLLASYTLFLEGRETAGARVGAADAALATALARAGARHAPPPRGGAWRWLAAAFAPVARPAWALAALAVVAFAAWRLAAPPGAPLLRGTGDTLARVATMPPEAAADSVVLRWKGTLRATAYAVHFFRMDLTELAAQPTGAATHLTLRRSTLPAGLPPHTRVLWQVVALRGSDALARSRTRPLDLP